MLTPIIPMALPTIFKASEVTYGIKYAKTDPKITKKLKIAMK